MASIEERLRDGRVTLNGWRKVLLLVAALLALGAALYAVEGLTAANESMRGVVGAGQGNLPASCSQAVVIPKRGWVCMEHMRERFDIAPGTGAAHRQHPSLNPKFKPHRVENK